MSETIALAAVILVGGLLFAGAYLGGPHYRRWRDRRRGREGVSYNRPSPSARGQVRGVPQDLTGATPRERPNVWPNRPRRPR